MALDPNILLQGRVPNLMQALTAGINAGNSLKEAPLIRDLQKARVAQASQALDSARQQDKDRSALANQKRLSQSGAFINKITGEMLNQSEDQRRLTVSQNADFIRLLGEDPNSIDISNDGLMKLNMATQVSAQRGPEKTVALSEGQRLVGAQTGRVIAEGGEKTPDTQPMVDKLRSRFDSFSKDLRSVNASLKKVESASNTGQGDISLVTGFMKLIDPGSTVREGEFATAEQAGGVQDSVINMYNKLVSGERLTSEQRENFKLEAKKLAQATSTATDEDVATILQQADQDRVPRAKVLGAKNLREFEQRAAQRLIDDASSGKKRFKFNPSTGRLE